MRAPRVEVLPSTRVHRTMPGELFRTTSGRGRENAVAAMTPRRDAVDAMPSAQASKGKKSRSKTLCRGNRPGGPAPKILRMH